MKGDGGQCEERECAFSSSGGVLFNIDLGELRSLNVGTSVLKLRRAHLGARR
jgi:hypothetical protein